MAGHEEKSRNLARAPDHVEFVEARLPVATDRQAEAAQEKAQGDVQYVKVDLVGGGGHTLARERQNCFLPMIHLLAP